MSQQLENTFLTPFIEASVKTLQELCKTETKLEKMGPRDSMPPFSASIAGVIGITGKKFQGAMSLSFPKSVFITLMNRMLSEENTEITADLTDGAAELSNIIFGHAKMALNEAGAEIKMALPSVLQGEELQSRSGAIQSSTVILLTTSAGPVCIEFTGRVISATEPTDDTSKKIQTPLMETLPKLDAHVLMSFIEGIRKTYKLQCGAVPVAGSPYLKNSREPYRFEIGGVLGITGSTFSGTFAMCYEKAVFLKVLERIFGEPITEITKDVEDGAAELVNIVFGVAKQILNEEGHALRMAIPTIVRGKSVTSQFPGQKPPIVVPFELFGGHFWVEFAFDHDKRINH